jgi:hypothetical protein
VNGGGNDEQPAKRTGAGGWKFSSPFRTPPLDTADTVRTAYYTCTTPLKGNAHSERRARLDDRHCDVIANGRARRERGQALFRVVHTKTEEPGQARH